MTEKTIYKYAFGSIEQIKQADFDKMLTSDDINDIRFTSNNSKGFTLPEFTGVYQNTTYGMDEDEGDDPLAILNQCFGAIIGAFANLGGKDEMDHDLISVIYDVKSGWTHSLVRSLLGVDSNRIAVFGRDDTPHFGEKDTSDVLSKIWGDVRSYYAGQKSEDRAKKFTKKWGTTITDLSKHLTTYGLTGSEYSSWRALTEIQDTSV